MSNTEILDFIQAERTRFEIEHDNIFAFSWGAVVRYRGFLSIIFKRYTQASCDFMENFKEQKAFTKPGNHPVTPEHMRVIEQQAEIGEQLHLEIESFYLFTKILLDKIAHALEFYFGKGRGLPLDSHDDLTKHLPEYAQQKKLHLHSSLIALITRCKKEISDYRDYQIAHEKSPRTMRGTMFSLDGTNMRMFLNQIYPKNKAGSHIESASPDALLKLVDEYIANILSFVTHNNEKTALRLKGSVTGRDPSAAASGQLEPANRH